MSEDNKQDKEFFDKLENIDKCPECKQVMIIAEPEPPYSICYFCPKCNIEVNKG